MEDVVKILALILEVNKNHDLNVSEFLLKLKNIYLTRGNKNRSLVCMRTLNTILVISSQWLCVWGRERSTSNPTSIFTYLWSCLYILRCQYDIYISLFFKLKTHWVLSEQYRSRLLILLGKKVTFYLDLENDVCKLSKEKRAGAVTLIISW